MKEVSDHELLERLSKQLEEQRRLLDSLSARLSELERKLWNPYKEPFMPYPSQPVKMADACPTCGLRFDQGAMGYVCSVPKCPTGLGGPWC